MHRRHNTDFNEVNYINSSEIKNRIKLTNNLILERNKHIKYTMYKNSKKNLLRDELFYDVYLKNPKSSRSQSLHAIRWE